MLNYLEVVARQMLQLVLWLSHTALFYIEIKIMLL